MNNFLFRKPKNVKVITLGELNDNYTYIPSCWYEPEEEKKMCDTSNVEKLLVILVQKEIEKMVEKQIIFSAWDITKKIREDVGPNYEIRHGDVREVVKDWFEKNSFIKSWNRTLIELQNGKVTFVYHPLTVLAEGYHGFSKLVDTTPKNVCGADCNCNDDSEQRYKKLFDVADTLVGDVSDFLDGELTLDQLQEALDQASNNISELE